MALCYSHPIIFNRHDELFKSQNGFRISKLEMKRSLKHLTGFCILLTTETHTLAERHLIQIPDRTDTKESLKIQ